MVLGPPSVRCVYQSVCVPACKRSAHVSRSEALKLLHARAAMRAPRGPVGDAIVDDADEAVVGALLLHRRAALLALRDRLVGRTARPCAVLVIAVVAGEGVHAQRARRRWAAGAADAAAAAAWLPA